MAGAFSNAFSSAFDIEAATATTVTIAGKDTAPAPRISRATQYFYKTLSELHREEKLRLAKLEKEARRRVEAAVEQGASEPGPLSEAARSAFERQRKGRTVTPSFLPEPFLNELVAMIVAEATAGFIESLMAEEDDIEVLLMAAA